MALATLAGAGAALLYSVGGHLSRRHLGGLPAAGVACATLSAAALLLLPFAAMSWPETRIDAQSWAAAAALGALCTGLAYVAYYRLVARIGANRTSAVTYLVPMFGVAWAWLLIDEPLTWQMAIAGLLILAGVVLGQWARKVSDFA